WLPCQSAKRGVGGVDTAPLGRTTAPAGVEVTDVDGARHHQVTTRRPTDLALPGTDRDAGLIACGGVCERVVVPAHRLLEPADVEVGQETRELDRLAKRPTLVGVDEKDEVVAGGRARRAHALCALLAPRHAH